MYVSSRPKSNMLATKKSRKGVTLYEVKQQNNVDLVVVLCFLSLVATLNMYFIDCFNLANVKNIVIAFIRNHCRVFLVNTSLYLDSRWNLCFTLTIAASVRWEIRMNLMIFCVSYLQRSRLMLKLQAVILATAILPR